ncbi:MAG TPA: SusD/RagB family nutrient-binding outer membrane lipoprotein [Longimicrobiales bacterium]|nr:SusD/RagB family nutrient-binding outer membrane lipoprotein [Longimicrobiales bacterium]
MNTTIRRGRVLGALLIAAVLVGCNDFISPTDLNPNAVPTATVDQLFTGIQVNTFYFSESQIARIASLWTQQMAGTDRQFAILDTYRLNEEDADGEFSALYTGGGLIDLRDAIGQAEESGRHLYAGILKIYEAYLFGMGASMFGDIPYSEAATEGIDAPGLDTQAEVYATVQSLLDQAIVDLGAGGAGPGSVDMNFAGNAANWTAVAHTLKARFHMHWAEVNGSSSYQAALAEAQQGIATSAGNWRAIHSTASTENNLWYQFMRDRSGYISSGDYLVPLMVAENDPRLPFYFSEASTGGYVARDSELSLTGYGAPDFNFPILSCAENAYIQAEASFKLGNEGGARTAAKAGLACQEAMWNVSLAALSSALDAKSGTALFEEIMKQKYEALFLDMEAFNDFKRTCLPAITQREGGMPARLYYGQAERQSNPNVPAPAQQPARNTNDPNSCS